jgi:small subunit ribosomal protein S17
MPRKEITGEVVSNKMDKTVVVAVELRVSHVRYEKQKKLTHKFKAHDDANKCQIGDIVRIRETRPLSKDKRWVVIDISGHATPGIELSEPEMVRRTGSDSEPESNKERKMDNHQSGEQL